MQTVYFICYGNICRSPFGERYAQVQATAQAREDWRFDSAGIGASNGHQCPGPGVTAAGELGVDLTGHRAKHVSEISPGPDDLCLASDRSVFGALADRLGVPLADVRGPGGSRLQLLMSQLGDGAGRGPQGLDVPDPMGSGVEAYRQSYRLIIQLVDRLLVAI